jgi:hypothetical protein
MPLPNTQAQASQLLSRVQLLGSSVASDLGVVVESIQKVSNATAVLMETQPPGEAREALQNSKQLIDTLTNILRRAAEAMQAVMSAAGYPTSAFGLGTVGPAATAPPATATAAVRRLPTVAPAPARQPARGAAVPAAGRVAVPTTSAAGSTTVPPSPGPATRTPTSHPRVTSTTELFGNE